MNDSNYRFIGSSLLILCEVFQSPVALFANQQLPFAAFIDVVDD
jgi:hypothetical protein